MELPKASCGFGLYYLPCKLGTVTEEEAFRHMAENGMNTFAPHAGPLPGETGGTPAEHLARSLNTAAQVGLTDTRFPVICYSISARDILAALKLRSVA